jgi:hypothetical protein
MKLDWTLIATVSSMVAFWVTALFILYQIRHMNRSRNLEVTMRMFEWSESNRMREAMRWVTTQFDLGAFLKQPESERSEYPGMIVAFFEQAGIMVQKKLVNEDVVIDHLALSALNSWKQLQPLIAHWRELMKDERVGEHFEYIYRRALNYEERYRKRRKK